MKRAADGYRVSFVSRPPLTRLYTGALLEDLVDMAEASLGPAVVRGWYVPERFEMAPGRIHALRA